MTIRLKFNLILICRFCGRVTSGGGICFAESFYDGVLRLKNNLWGLVKFHTGGKARELLKEPNS